VLSPIQEIARTLKLKKGPAFFKRHGRLVSFIRALIVFCSFVAKEGEQESTKSAMDAIDYRIEFFNIRTEEIRTRDQLSQLLKIATRNEEKRSATSKQQVTEFDQIWQDRHDVFERNFAALGSMQDTQSLMLAVPYTKTQERMERVEVSIRTIFQDEDSFRRLESEGRNNLERTSDARKRREILKQLKQQVNHLEENTDWWVKSAEDYRREAIDVSSEYKEELESEYAQYSHICTALFVLGWGLGLTVRIYNGGSGVESA
jgi:hypothetical protein